MQNPDNTPLPEPAKPDVPADPEALNPSDIPDRLPDHPDEARLQQAELELAKTIRKIARHAAQALEGRHPRRRVDAAVLLTQLAQAAEFGRRAEVNAIRDQMALLTQHQKPNPQSDE